MEKQIVSSKLTEIFRKVFNDSNIVLRDELTANDVDQWDSLTHMILVTEIENEFAIKFKLKELNKMRNVGDMIEIILSKV
jgi:acyl carrier protein